MADDDSPPAPKRQQQPQPRRAAGKKRSLRCARYGGLVALLWCFTTWALSLLRNHHRYYSAFYPGIIGSSSYHRELDGILGGLVSGNSRSNMRRLNLNLPWLPPNPLAPTPPEEAGSVRSGYSTLAAVPFVWESSSVLPAWMKEYFAWHHKERLLLNETNWQTQKYLIMRCLNVDAKCGGASDRIKSIPFAVLLARSLNRILLIKWERPYPLEEFLVPPSSGGGLNWCVPEWMSADLQFRRVPNILTSSHAKQYLNGHDNDVMVVDMRHQSHDHGSDYYDEIAAADNEPSFEDVYRDTWTVFFEPSPPVSALIRQRLEELQLQPGRYSSVHIRSMYTRNRANNIDMIRNAVQCASMLAPSLPIFVASDSVNVTLKAIAWGSENGRVVRGADHTIQLQQHVLGGDVAQIANTTEIQVRKLTNGTRSSPLHLDRGSDFLSRSNPDWMDHPPSAYYDVFVDLYLLAQSRCVAYDLGGYGRWGAVLSSDRTCIINHARNSCAWGDDNGGGHWSLW